MTPTAQDFTAEVAERVMRASRRVAELVAAAPQPHVRAVGQWSVLDTVRHLTLGAEFFAAVARDEGAPLHDLQSNAVATADAVAAEPETDLRVLAARMVRADESLVTAARRDAQPVEVFRGVVMAMPILLALELGELLVHGLDIAHASGRQWAIDPDDARRALTSTTTLLPYLIDPVAARNMQVTCELRVTGGHRSTIHVANGVATEVPVGSARPDAILTGEPVTFLLVSFGRTSVVQSILTGRLLPHGRKPWAVARLLGAVVSP
jgi:hypothetical protein